MYKRVEHVEWQQFDDESILLNVETGVYFRLNEVGSFIWPLLDGRHRESEIVAAVLDSFQIDEQSARRDFQEFVRQLEKEGLLRQTES